MDPLIPETWYNIPREDVKQTKVGEAKKVNRGKSIIMFVCQSGSMILQKLKGYFSALQTLFSKHWLGCKSLYWVYVTSRILNCN